MTDEKDSSVEFNAGKAKQAEFYFRKAFGISWVAYSGIETGNDKTTNMFHGESALI